MPPKTSPSEMSIEHSKSELWRMFFERFESDIFYYIICLFFFLVIHQMHSFCKGSTSKSEQPGKSCSVDRTHNEHYKQNEPNEI